MDAITEVLGDIYTIERGQPSIVRDAIALIRRDEGIRYRKPANGSDPASLRPAAWIPITNRYAAESEIRSLPDIEDAVRAVAVKNGLTLSCTFDCQRALDIQIALCRIILSGLGESQSENSRLRKVGNRPQALRYWQRFSRNTRSKRYRFST